MSGCETRDPNELGIARVEIMSGIDVLNLEWTSRNCRDRLMATLVCNYLRHQGLNVVEGSIFDGFHLFHTLQPRLLFMTNTIGARENYLMMRYAKKRGALGISLISEGNLREEPEFA